MKIHYFFLIKICNLDGKICIFISSKSLVKVYFFSEINDLFKANPQVAVDKYVSLIQILPIKCDNTFSVEYLIKFFL